ncbi:MAG: putative anti-sigma regulatory factor, serine/threonine protein kinase [Verrucomicrobiales bacterium]|nr:putative anti-sigma regulatory factor, serine/threonine protein kinase [Verrucomicrobiales bacterium]
MPILLKSETLEVTEERDIVTVRQAVRRVSLEIRLSLVDQTKVITAASELARNLLIYGGGGEVVLEQLQEGARQGVRVHFVDEGPGIENIEVALRDGYTSGGGMGLGLGGAKRLVNEFELVSAPGKGTRITITRWK